MKYPLIIQIRWMHAIETLLLEHNATPKLGEEFHTTEVWDDGNRQVTYVTRVLEHELKGSQHRLILEYLPDVNPEIASEIDCWGTSTVTFDIEGMQSAKATWKNDPPNSKYDGTVTNVNIIPAGGPEFLGFVSSLRRKRRQDFFKRALLKIEPCCALSGETELSVLEAAHIVEVKKDGNNGPSNGFLLRADLHRLFDNGTLIIDPESGEVKLDKSVSRKSNYRKQALGWKLSDSTLKRVRSALLQRTEGEC